MIFNPSSGGAIKLLSAVNVAAAVASIDFTGLDGSYPHYWIALQNLVPVTDGALLQGLFTLDNGATWPTLGGTYETVMFSSTMAGTTGALGIPSDSAAFLSFGVSATMDLGGFSADVRLADVASTTRQKTLRLVGEYPQVSAGRFTFHSASSYLPLAAINGVRFAYSSGNIAAGGKAFLYGVAGS